MPLRYLEALKGTHELGPKTGQDVMVQRLEGWVQLVP
jgi:hypothetical protein